MCVHFFFLFSFLGKVIVEIYAADDSNPHSISISPKSEFIELRRPVMAERCITLHTSETILYQTHKKGFTYGSGVIQLIRLLLLIYGMAVCRGFYPNNNYVYS